MYELFTMPSGQRALRRLDQDVQDHLIKGLQVPRTKPDSSLQLKAQLRFLRALHTRYRNSDYRVAYEVDHKAQSIIAWYAAGRENFYKNLEKKLPQALGPR